MELVEDFRARMEAGAATPKPAETKKHRRVSERLSEIAIGSSLHTEPLELVTGVYSFGFASVVPNREIPC
jgi:hypothetical protein